MHRGRGSRLVVVVVGRMILIVLNHYRLFSSSPVYWPEEIAPTSSLIRSRSIPQEPFSREQNRKPSIDRPVTKMIYSQTIVVREILLKTK